MDEEDFDYDVKIHLPQRMENLFQAKESLNVLQFNNVLSDIMKIMKEEKQLIDGINSDNSERDVKVKEALADLREQLKKALDVKNDGEMVYLLDHALNMFKSSSEGSEVKFMDDAVESITSYIESMKKSTEDKDSG